MLHHKPKDPFIILTGEFCTISEVRVLLAARAEAVYLWGDLCAFPCRHHDFPLSYSTFSHNHVKA